MFTIFCKRRSPSLGISGGGGFSKMLKFLYLNFYVMGKVMSGKLFYMWTGLFHRNTDGSYQKSPGSCQIYPKILFWSLCGVWYYLTGNIVHKYAFHTVR